jgi:hypothetical protein
MWSKHKWYTRPETICPRTSKLACWRVQLSIASKVGRRGAGPATASIEASLLAGDISYPLAQWYHLCWRTSYVDRQHIRFSGGGLHKPTANTNGPISAGGWLISTASSDLYYWRLSYAPTNTVKLKIAWNWYKSPIFQHGQQQQVKFKLKYQHKQHLRKAYFTQTTCMITNVSKHT